MVPTNDKSTNAILGVAAFHTSERKRNTPAGEVGNMSPKVELDAPFRHPAVGVRNMRDQNSRSERRKRLAKIA
jgi:hypothetical protein